MLCPEKDGKRVQQEMQTFNPRLSEPASNNWAPMTAEDCAFRMDSEKTSAVLDLLHDRARGLFPQLEPAVNEVEEVGKGGSAEKLTFSTLVTETPGEVSKVNAPPIKNHKQS